MRFTTYLAPALGALSFAAAEYEIESAAPPVSKGAHCASPPPTDGYLELAKAMYESNGTYLANNFIMAAADEAISINIYWHVVAGAKTVKEGWVSDQDIAGQLAVLNKAYQPHKFSFKTAAISRNVNATWTFRPSDAAKTDMQKLRKGTYADLNMYIQKGVGAQGVAGYCYLPAKGVNKNKPLSYDGCYINSDTLPSAGPTGFTAVHEVGHWLGLPHTFSTSCSDTTNDMIADTPTHLNSPVDGNNCNKKYDSCPNQPGNDPVHNYMSYFPEKCKSEFTKGQEARMREMWFSARNA